MVAEELQKDENTLKQLKEQDFLEGDIYGDETNVAYRSKSYELFKAGKNPLADGAVDLILTGDFVDAMYLLKPKQGRYRFGNRDKKRNKLVRDYGLGIFSLNQKVFNKYLKDITAPRLKRNISKILNKR
jgi:hypothetical protein